MPPPTLRSVAEAAGVSVSSVSNAYNRPGQLSAAVRERILAVAADLGYSGPNPAARSLRTNRVGAIGVLLTSSLPYVFSDPYCIALLQGISEEAARTRTALVLLPQVDADAVGQAVIDAAISDALEDSDPAMAALTSRRLPVARSVDSAVGTCVFLDEEGAGRSIGEHLSELGHQELTVVVGPSAGSDGSVDESLLPSYSRLRVRGIREGFAPGRVLVVSAGANSTAAGQNVGARLLGRTPRPTAIAADSDVLALGILDAARTYGLHPGKDLSVTGFDDIHDAAEAGLTTVAQPIREKGRLLAKSILDPENVARRTVLDTALIPRRSTGPHTAGAQASAGSVLPPRNTGPTTQGVAAEWQIDELDLPSYLHRIGYAGDTAPAPALLEALHRAHLAAIPFENLDIILGRSIEVDLASIQTKLIYHRRGGYCYEQNLLLGAVLERLGFTVSRVLARTGDPLEKPRPRSHLVLIVELEDRRWLADVGFGSGIVAPLPLTDATAHRQGAWTFRAVVGPDGAWRLRELIDGFWQTRYTFTETPDHLVDVEVANRNTSTSPTSPFTKRPIIVAKDEHRIMDVIGRELSTTEPDRPAVRRQLSDAEFRDALRERLPLTDTEVASILAVTPEVSTDA